MLRGRRQKIRSDGRVLSSVRTGYSNIRKWLRTGYFLKVRQNNNYLEAKTNKSKTTMKAVMIMKDENVKKMKIPSSLCVVVVVVAAISRQRIGGSHTESSHGSSTSS
ncbi:hypothetical protein ElyMa_006474100 [Elysia marginata]|uniref:Uncharacterized protein n=1 Tax=Elysia marginata TaxID=1093978 RepID=A0AAV4I3J2_9GAST|nr:hypothetical protein ElyMa_006474100 [Elysia marginata]